MRVVVTDLEHLDALRGADSVVSILDPNLPVPPPVQRMRASKLHLRFHDIWFPMTGLIHPQIQHVDLIRRHVELSRPQVLGLHCHAGISRSTAAALIALKTARPEADERELVEQLLADRPQAYPNGLMLELHDFKYGSRFVEAVPKVIADYFYTPGQVTWLTGGVL